MQVNLPKRVASPTGGGPLAVQPDSVAAAASLRAEQLQRELNVLKAQWSKRQAKTEAQSVDYEHRQRLLRSAAGEARKEVLVLRQHKAKAEADLDALRKQMIQMRQQIADLMSGAAEYEQVAKEARADADALREAARSHEGELSAARHEVEVKSGQAARLVEEIEQLEVQLRAKEGELAQVPAIVQRQEARLAEALALAEHRGQALAREQAENTALQEELCLREREAEALEARLRGAKTQASKQAGLHDQATVAQLEREAEESLAIADDLEARLAQVPGSTDALKLQHGQSLERIRALEAERAEGERKVENLRLELADMDARCNELQDRLDSATLLLHKAEEEGARQAKALGVVVGEKCDLEVLLSDLEEKLEGALVSSAASRQQVEELRSAEESTNLLAEAQTAALELARSEGAAARAQVDCLMEEIADAAAAMRRLFPSSVQPDESAEPSGAVERFRLALNRAQSLSSEVRPGSVAAVKPAQQPGPKSPRSRLTRQHVIGGLVLLPALTLAVFLHPAAAPAAAALGRSAREGLRWAGDRLRAAP